MAGIADRVKETSTTTGTGTLNLAGVVTGYRSFVAGIGTGTTCYYCIEHQTAAEWEVGIGTVTDASPDTLSRTTVLASSNGGSLVSLSAGTKNVFVTYPAGRAVLLDVANVFSARQTMKGSSGGFVGDGASNIFQITTGTGAAADEKIEIGILDGSYTWIQASKPGTSVRSLILNPNGGVVNIGTVSPSGAALLNINTVPSANWTISGANSSSLVTIANDATYDLATGGGLIVLHDDGLGHLVMASAGGGTTAIMTDAFAVASITQGTASKFNIYYNAGTAKYRIENKRGVSKNIYITSIMTRPSG